LFSSPFSLLLFPYAYPQPIGITSLRCYVKFKIDASPEQTVLISSNFCDPSIEMFIAKKTMGIKEEDDWLESDKYWMHLFPANANN